MPVRRLTFIYLATYLLVGGGSLLVAPDLALRLLLSNGAYGDIMPRLFGLFMFVLGGVICANVEASCSEFWDFAGRLRCGPRAELGQPTWTRRIDASRVEIENPYIPGAFDSGGGSTGVDDDNPPYHTDVFILTHHARGPIQMEGGTAFHFVTEGLQVALEKARSAAKGKDVRLGGGVSAIRQLLQVRLIDDMHIAISPVMLGKGEHLFGGIDTLALGYRCTKHVASPNAAHFVLTRQP